MRLVVLTAREPAPAQMARALAGRSEVDVIHILAHGQPGELGFAAGVLSSVTLDHQGDDLRAVGRSTVVSM